MVKNFAFLVGVADYTDPKIPSLPFVRNDLVSLSEALKQVGYKVKSLGAEPGTTGRSQIWTSLRRECRQAEGVENLILYFSGHGIHFQGQDYLVPSDAQRDALFEDPEIARELLVPTDIADVVDVSPASNILLIIDACREGLTFQAKALAKSGLTLAGWGTGEALKATQRRFVKVYGCAAGRLCYGAPDYSLFTQALIQSLAPNSPARTVGEVFQHANRNLQKLYETHKTPVQVVRLLTEISFDDNVLERPFRFDKFIPPSSPPLEAKEEMAERPELLVKHQAASIPAPTEPFRYLRQVPELQIKPQAASPIPQRSKPGPVVDKDDTQHQRWGGKSTRKNRKLTARYLEADADTFWVDLVVSATGASELRGPVFFHLDETFPRSVIRIDRIREGKEAVCEQVSAIEVFTVGAQVLDDNNEWVGLEFNLARLGGIPKRFRPRDKPHQVSKTHRGRVMAALENPEYEWRTTAGVASETGLSSTVVRQIIASAGDQIVQAPERDQHGNKLYKIAS
jgi:hypothetical protein